MKAETLHEQDVLSGVEHLLKLRDVVLTAPDARYLHRYSEKRSESPQYPCMQSVYEKLDSKTKNGTITGQKVTVPLDMSEVSTLLTALDWTIRDTTSQDFREKVGMHYVRLVQAYKKSSYTKSQEQDRVPFLKRLTRRFK